MLLFCIRHFSKVENSERLWHRFILLKYLWCGVGHKHPCIQGKWNEVVFSKSEESIVAELEIKLLSTLEHQIRFMMLNFETSFYLSYKSWLCRITCHLDNQRGRIPDIGFYMRKMNMLKIKLILVFCHTRNEIIMLELHSNVAGSVGEHGRYLQLLHRARRQPCAAG